MCDLAGWDSCWYAVCVCSAPAESRRSVAMVAIIHCSGTGVWDRSAGVKTTLSYCCLFPSPSVKVRAPGVHWISLSAGLQIESRWLSLDHRWISDRSGAPRGSNNVVMVQ